MKLNEILVDIQKASLDLIELVNGVKEDGYNSKLHSRFHGWLKKHGISLTTCFDLLISKRLLIQEEENKKEIYTTCESLLNGLRKIIYEVNVELEKFNKLGTKTFNKSYVFYTRIQFYLLATKLLVKIINDNAEKEDFQEVKNFSQQSSSSSGNLIKEIQKELQDETLFNSRMLVTDLFKSISELYSRNYANLKNRKVKFLPNGDLIVGNTKIVNEKKRIIKFYFLETLYENFDETIAYENLCAIVRDKHLKQHKKSKKEPKQSEQDFCYNTRADIEQKIKTKELQELFRKVVITSKTQGGKPGYRMTNP